MPRITRGEDQRVHDPVRPLARVEQQPHAAEVDLAFVARLTIRNAHRRAATAAPAARLEHVTLHLRHGTVTPRRSSSSWIFTPVRSDETHTTI
jgi:hypothetical protein